MELPEYLTRAEVARLFPVIAEVGKEQRAVSILLSCLSAAPPLAHSILSQLGQRVGKKTYVDTYTEVVFRNEKDPKNTDRPDGLVIVATNRGRFWSCLVEAKIGKSRLYADQVDRYLKLARDNSIDAVLTISNQFAAHATHHPLGKEVKRPKNVELFHLSWGYLLTEAIRIHHQSEAIDPEQAFLIREMVRFFSHKSAGVEGFTQMPNEWGDAISKIQAGGKPLKADALTIAGAWHQELKDLCLIMTRFLNHRVEARMKKKYISDPYERANDDANEIVSKGQLSADLIIPNAAAPIQIVADIKSRCIRLAMTVEAPRDKKRNSSRLTWLLRQLKKVDPSDIHIAAIWASRAPSTGASLEQWLKDPKALDSADSNAEIRAFEITRVSNSVNRFSGVRTFITELEQMVPTFYEEIGQHLSPWRPNAPKPSKPLEEKIDKHENGEPMDQISSGNNHSALLEIPHFINKS